MTGHLTRSVRHAAIGVAWLLLGVAGAQETTCARVKIEIKQELTLERQAFDAEMRINNTTESGVIENVAIEVKATDETGTPVRMTSNPNDLTAAFFIRVSAKQNINSIDGAGTVAPASTAIINWLIVPAPGAGGTTEAGKKYLIGATLRYRYQGEDTTLELSPDVITVKPMPLLTLDYFLPRDVFADDPLTAEIEPVEPFTLGVRVKNNGAGPARNLKIESAQPRIVENQQGLLIDFRLTGSFVNDSPVENSLLIGFGDIPSAAARHGRWIMETSLSGQFTEFKATFTHADEFGGALTSLLQATNAHVLVRDVRVDLPGSDSVRDFLGESQGALRVYESGGSDSPVIDRSASAQITATGGSGNNPVYRLALPPAEGFFFVRLPDPLAGTRALGSVVRGDGKRMLPENLWLSRVRNKETKVYEYYINAFDSGGPGTYETEFIPIPPSELPPQIQLIPDRTVREGEQVSFLVEASSPARRPVTITAAPLPTGAIFFAEPSDPQAPSVARAVFDWTPARGQAGRYPITYTASDGAQAGSRVATITVEAQSGGGGPGTPAVVQPVSGAEVPSLRPTLSVLPGGGGSDTATAFQFELYRDAALTQLVASALVPRATDLPGGASAPTEWAVPSDLEDNTRYHWRARAQDASSTFSPWAYAEFFVNLFNDPPEAFNLAAPPPNGEVAEVQPLLSWSNSSDRDGDALSYGVRVYQDAGLSELVTSVDGLAPDASGVTAWRVDKPLTLRARYFWRVVARDARGAETQTAARPFYVGVGNSAPTAPAIVSPPVGSSVPALAAVLTVANATDADGDVLTYLFELDSAPGFDSGARQVSPPIPAGAGGTSGWPVSGLLENQRYHWRVKAQDGRSESPWTVGVFVASVINEPPPVPAIRNPGNGAWVATQQPTLEAAPVVDPEGDAVSYEFEVYLDAGLQQRVASGSSSGAWTVPAPLADRTTHWWRVRAVDAQSTASAWSLPAVMYVSSGPYQEPSIQVLAPAVVAKPPGDKNGTVLIQWVGSDPNIDATVALYHAPNRDAFAGTLIVDGLRQPAGTFNKSYEWVTAGLAPGAYEVFAVIYDSRGSARAWAPGAVVVPTQPQAGQVVVDGARLLQTDEAGGTAGFEVRLASRPAAPVTVPVSSSNLREVGVAPATLSFDAENWGKGQRVTLTGRPDCLRDGDTRVAVTIGAAVTRDPDFIGVFGPQAVVTNRDTTTRGGQVLNARELSVCDLRVESSRKLNPTTWEYVVSASMGNSGPPIAGVDATLLPLPAGIVIKDGTLSFGALGTGDVGRSSDTLVLQSRTPLGDSFFQTAIGWRWQVAPR